MRSEASFINPDIKSTDLVQPEIFRTAVERHDNYPLANNSARAIKEQMNFRHGELEAGHPLQQFAADLAARLPSKEGFPLSVHVLPQWRHTQAVCLLDGSVFVSAGLIENCQSQEELMGVIAHEYTHGYRQHIAKTLEQAEKAQIEIGQKRDITKKAESYAKAQLKIAGSRRMQEYEADLRGIVELLEKANVNPLGYKQFYKEGRNRATGTWNTATAPTGL